jgi:hypothetical protein
MFYIIGFVKKLSLKYKKIKNPEKRKPVILFN